MLKRIHHIDFLVRDMEQAIVQYTRIFGVQIEHRNAVHFVRAFNQVCKMSPEDRVYQGFSLGFDGSVEELWMAFSNGATLVVGTSDVVKFGDEVARVFIEEEVTVFSTVPTFLSCRCLDLRRSCWH